MATNSSPKVKDKAVSGIIRSGSRHITCWYFQHVDNGIAMYSVWCELVECVILRHFFIGASGIIAMTHHMFDLSAAEVLLMIWVLIRLFNQPYSWGNKALQCETRSVWFSSSPHFLFSILHCGKGKSLPECWIAGLYLDVRLWISVLTVSENELFRFCRSLISLHLHASAFLLPPFSLHRLFLTPHLSFNNCLPPSLCQTSLFTLCFCICLSSLAQSVILLFLLLPHFPSFPCYGPIFLSLSLS